MVLQKPRTPAEICLTANGWKLWPGRVLRWRTFSRQSPIFVGARLSTTIARWSNWHTPAAKRCLMAVPKRSSCARLGRTRRPSPHKPRLRLRVRVNFNRGPRLICRVTQLFQSAIGTLWTACYAEFPTVPDHFVRKVCPAVAGDDPRSEEHTSELQSQSNLVCRL